MNNHVLIVYTDRVHCEVKVQYSINISVYTHDSIVSDTVLVKWRYSASYLATA